MEKSVNVLISEAIDYANDKDRLLLQRIIEKDEYPQEDVSDTFIEMLYTYGYQLFESQKHEKAIKIFEYLTAVGTGRF